MTLDYRTADADQILTHARSLRGKRLGELGYRFKAIEGSRGKQEVGHAIEAYFGIPLNSRREADFPGARIELKVVPLVRGVGHLRIKERTVLGVINYETLVLEEWATASIRHKMHILFVFFEHLTGVSKELFPIRDVALWEPDARTIGFLEQDWDRVRRKIRWGQAHLLSESDGRMMGPCTKSVDATKRRPQPFANVPAKPRAFALKPSFTREIWREAQHRRAQALDERAPAEGFEEQLVARFARFVGRQVGDVGDELGVPRSLAKSYAASVVRRAFGASSFKVPIKEFEEMGLTPRITRVGRGQHPYEALSFPAFDYFALLEEDWEDSDLLSRVEYMLFVPVRGQTRSTPQTSCVFGEPVFWRPTTEDLNTIRAEWELFRIEIQNGRAEHLTPASETVAIHVRPHARDGADRIAAPGGARVVKKGFWLNQDFVQRILLGATD